MIREAVHMLEHDGLVRTKKGPGGGIFVNEWNPLQVIESISFTIRRGEIPLEGLLEARRSVEDRIARLAAIRATKKDLEKMFRILTRMEKLKADQILFVRLDTEFHASLAEAARNKVLLVFMLVSKEISNRVISQLHLPDDLHSVAMRYHWEIYEAVKRKDAEKAAAAMLAHLRYFEKRVKKEVLTNKLNRRVIGL